MPRGEIYVFDPDDPSHRPSSLRSLQHLLVRLGNGHTRVPQHLPPPAEDKPLGPCAMAVLVERLVNQRTRTTDSRPTTPWPKSDWTTQFPKTIEKFTKTGKLKKRPKTLPKLKGANAALAVSDSMHAYQDLLTAFVGVASTTPRKGMLIRPNIPQEPSEFAQWIASQGHHTFMAAAEAFYADSGDRYA